MVSSQVGELLHRYGRTKTVIWGSSVNSVHEMAYAYVRITYLCLLLTKT